MLFPEIRSLNRRNGLGSLLQKPGNKNLESLIAIAGYAHDPNQDIFYSTMDSWQRDVGFCHLYDEAASPLSMIIDCEPVYFEYDGEKWLIEFWKGQYGMVTGGEIGVYTGGIDVKILGIYNDTFYNCASEDNLLEMSYTLKKNGSILFAREGTHWWLTGFKLGEFSEPSELSMDISITLKDEIMRDAFLGGFRSAGYSDNEYTVVGNTVNFTFDIPRTQQPRTRTKVTDWMIQRKNELLCNIYQSNIYPRKNYQLSGKLVVPIILSLITLFSLATIKEAI
ncbi:MAG: hypothetical protein APF84_07065 [Gracilibacter sp. BRH_c7a]|nr:MAG: hypothetical protein APF84_07065 [Gracilibacter sp. BRH_c7a]